MTLIKWEMDVGFATSIFVFSVGFLMFCVKLSLSTLLLTQQQFPCTSVSSYHNSTKCRNNHIDQIDYKYLIIK